MVGLSTVVATASAGGVTVTVVAASAAELSPLARSRVEVVRHDRRAPGSERRAVLSSEKFRGIALGIDCDS
jgi:hypothetical protein